MDDALEVFIQQISDAHPGYAPFIIHLTTLASSYLPPFIYITDANNARITAAVIDSILSSVIPDAPPTLYAHINSVSCVSPRVFYDTVLNTLAGWTPSWENGCRVWPGDDVQRYNDSLDSFLHGLRRLSLERTGDRLDKKGKGKARAIPPADERDPSMVILIERAERLPECFPELVIPLSRLAELSRAKISVVMLSSVCWEDLRPSLGASPDPYYIDVEPLTKQDVLSRISSAFPSEPSESSGSDSPMPSHSGDATQFRKTYHPALKPLYDQYIETLYDAVSIYTHHPLELQYIAAARWPGFVQPVIDQYEARARQPSDEEHERDDEGSDPPQGLELPGMDGRLRLIQFFLPTFREALETLYPRLENATDWAARHHHYSRQDNKNEEKDGEEDEDVAVRRHHVTSNDVTADPLPRMSKFILVAAFLASTNPAKTDLRMFGRGPEGSGRRKSVRSRRKGPTSPSKRNGGGAQTIVKVSQRLLGPATFPLDRLLAILGALLEEHDFETRPHDPRFGLPGEYTDMELGRIHVYAAIVELTLIRALHTTKTGTSTDRSSSLLDGSYSSASGLTLKCGISYDVALGLAKDLGVKLNEWMWDPA